MSQGIGGLLPPRGVMDQDDDAAAEGAPPMPPETGRNRKASVPNAGFDAWLRRGLHELFDDVAREPIPPELLRLIERDREK